MTRANPKCLVILTQTYCLLRANHGVNCANIDGEKGEPKRNCAGLQSKLGCVMKGTKVQCVCERERETSEIGEFKVVVLYQSQRLLIVIYCLESERENREYIEETNMHALF